MFQRLIRPSSNSSFFIFGARGTGKSTFIEKQLLPSWNIVIPDDFRWRGSWNLGNILYYDFLNDELEESFAKDPERLKKEIAALTQVPEWVIIDEVQKVPRILDVIHSLIARQNVKFILSGSSARKLRQDGANLLAGRAFEYSLMPLTSFEIASGFLLEEALNYGTLPGLFSFTQEEDKIKYLKSYVRTYIKTEIQMEQVFRKLEPFRNFLEVAAQMNGKILNFAKIGREIAVDTKTIQSYYQVLEETFLGFRLPSYNKSIRKSQLLSPKFYFFDIGVKRALEESLHSKVAASTSYYGEVFEHFIILEFFRLNHYFESDYRLSYFATKEGAEVDLVLSRGKEVIFIEIKSSSTIDPVEVNKLVQIGRGNATQCFYLSQCQSAQQINGVRCLSWQQGLREVFYPTEKK